MPVTFRVTRGAGSITQADTVTNSFGIAQAVATLGPNPGSNIFVGSAGGLTVQFQNRARAQPVITQASIVNAASQQLANGIVPGSYITLYGTGLSDTTNVATTVSLPLALDGVSVSFDAPGASLAGAQIMAGPIAEYTLDHAARYQHRTP